MSIVKHKLSNNAGETERLAEAIGRKLNGGEVIELRSDLGGGKTTFVRGLARGAGSQDQVASPTFTISRLYQAPKYDIHHFDFYRLDEPGIMQADLAEFVGDPGAVAVIEWADVVGHVLPQKRLAVTITQTPEGNRKLTLTCPPDLGYLLEDPD